MRDARAFLSLGSNLGDRGENLREALRLLGGLGVRILRVSSFYETEPMDVRDQPWFVNITVEVETELAPESLLAAALSVERAMGRERVTPKGPRRIDIDILLYEDRLIRAPGLVVPHPRMAERRFVLEPMAEIAPELRQPESGRTMSELLDTVRGGKVKRLSAGSP